MCTCGYVWMYLVRVKCGDQVGVALIQVGSDSDMFHNIT